MINIQSSDIIIRLITYTLAYLGAATGAGFFKAWVAKKMGDDLPEQLGYLTLNPVAHVDFFGMMLMLMFGFGWGQHVPVNPLLYFPPLRYLKLASAFFADSLAHLIMALAGMCFLIATFGQSILPIVSYMTMSYGTDISHIGIAHTYPEHSTILISVAFVVIAFSYLNIALSVLKFLINTVAFGMTILGEYNPRMSYLNSTTYFIVSVLLILFCLRPLRILAIYSLSYAGYYIAYILGMV